MTFLHKLKPFPSVFIKFLWHVRVIKNTAYLAPSLQSPGTRFWGTVRSQANYLPHLLWAVPMRVWLCAATKTTKSESSTTARYTWGGVRASARGDSRGAWRIKENRGYWMLVMKFVTFFFMVCILAKMMFSIVNLSVMFFAEDQWYMEW